jgi:CBS domain-containing membrane protein
MNRLMVKDIMSTNLVTLDENENLDLAENAMKYGRIRHLPVVRGKRLVGLITHRDLLRAQVSSLADLSPEENSEVNVGIKAHDVMQESVTTVGPTTPILEAARIIKNNKFGCLPVVEDKNLVGIVTEADFIDLVIRALED